VANEKVMCGGPRPGGDYEKMDYSKKQLQSSMESGAEKEGRPSYLKKRSKKLLLLSSHPRKVCA
jgi:hypothetical protein